MKTLKSFMLLVGILLGSTVFYSCIRGKTKSHNGDSLELYVI